jgi:hypothetical protein
MVTMEQLTQSWPLALVVIVVTSLAIFRSPISELIRRARSVTLGDKSIDLTGGQTPIAVVQQKEEEEITAHAAPETVPSSHAMPQPSEVHAPIEQQLQASIPGDLPRDLEKAWLIRSIAIARMERTHEMHYRLILGSQIELMMLANTPLPPTESRARELYDRAKATFPAIYSTFSFESWSQWPMNAGLLRAEKTSAGSTVFRTTPMGRDFMHYLVDNSLTAGKAG